MNAAERMRVERAMNGEIPEHRRIQDLEGWLQDNGLRAPDDENNNNNNTYFSSEEERQRWNERHKYQLNLHERLFSEAKQKDIEEQRKRKQTLENWKHLKLEIETENSKIVVPLIPLAESCDTIFALASSRDSFASSSSSNDKKSNLLKFSLESYPQDTVQEFLSVVLHKSKMVAEIQDEHLIDCCRIAHYVQNNQVLNAIHQILLKSVDTENCLSLCQFADQLGLHDLLEKSMSQMMSGIQDLEDNDAWDDLTPELQDRILNIKSAIQSSIHSQRTNIHFSSLEEYISIFAERVQYYRERLAEAKEQHLQQIPGSQSYMDVEQKIARQERRVQTLVTALKEQKKLFLKNRS